MRRTGKKAERKNRMLSNRKLGESGRKIAKAEWKKEEAEHESGKRKAYKKQTKESGKGELR